MWFAHDLPNFSTAVQSAVQRPNDDDHELAHQLFHVFRRFVSILGVHFELIEKIFDFIFERQSKCP